MIAVPSALLAVRPARDCEAVDAEAAAMPGP